jgi:RND family efflux transporter MFP subunit
MQGRHLVVLGILLVATGCNEATTQAPEVRPVRTTTVDPKPIPDDRRAVGEIKPRHESDLAFRVAGKLTAREVDIGVTVRKGDLLARLDDQDYRNKLKAAQADLVAAQAVLVEARAAEGRLSQLLASGSTTRANHDVAVKNLRSAEAKLDSAQSGVEQAKDQLAYAELRADFDGIVTAVSAEPGQVVNTGQMILRVARSDEKDAVFTVAESVLGDGNGGKPEITVALLSNPNVTADGVVREISPISDPATRTYQVKVTLTNPPEQMRFGGSIAGRLKTSTVPVVVLPGSALFDRAGQPAVWVVDPAKGQVTLKTVVAERYETDRVIVSGGLAKGDIVVTAGVNRLREHQKVQLAEGAVR